LSREPGAVHQEAGEQGGEPVVDAVGEHGPEPAVERLDALQQVREAVGAWMSAAIAIGRGRNAIRRRRLQP
jgi:hypothetical protein